MAGGKDAMLQRDGYEDGGKIVGGSRTERSAVVTQEGDIDVLQRSKSG